MSFFMIIGEASIKYFLSSNPHLSTCVLKHATLLSKATHIKGGDCYPWSTLWLLFPSPSRGTQKHTKWGGHRSIDFERLQNCFPQFLNHNKSQTGMDGRTKLVYITWSSLWCSSPLAPLKIHSKYFLLFSILRCWLPYVKGIKCANLEQLQPWRYLHVAFFFLLCTLSLSLSLSL